MTAMAMVGVKSERTPRCEAYKVERREPMVTSLISWILFAFVPCIRRSQLTSPHSLLYGPLSRHACGWERRNRRKCVISDIARAWLPEFRAGIHRCRHRSLHVLVVTYFAPHLKLGRARCSIPSVAAGPAPKHVPYGSSAGGTAKGHTHSDGGRGTLESRRSDRQPTIGNNYGTTGEYGT